MSDETKTRDNTGGEEDSVVTQRGATDEATASENTTVDADHQDDDDGSGREAAKYRRRLRDTESERDALVQRVEAMQRGEAERLAGQHLADGADLWRDGLQVADLLDDAGHVDPEKVSEHAAKTTEAHPHWQRRQPPQPIKRGVFASGASSPNDRVAPSWAQALGSTRQ